MGPGQPPQVLFLCLWIVVPKGYGWQNTETMEALSSSGLNGAHWEGGGVGEWLGGV